MSEALGSTERGAVVASEALMNALREASSIKNSAAEHSMMSVTAYMPGSVLRGKFKSTPQRLFTRRACRTYDSVVIFWVPRHPDRVQGDMLRCSTKPISQMCAHAG